MDEFLVWIKKQKHDSFIKNHLKYFKNVFENCLDIKNEKILIITDYGSINKRVAPLMAYAYYESAKKLGLNVEIVTQKIKKNTEKIEKKVKEKIKDLKPNNIIIVSCSNRLGNFGKKPFRRFCREKKHKFISTTSLGEISTRNIYSIIETININYKKLSRDSKKIKEKLDNARFVKIITKKGTDLTFDITGQKSISNDGNYTKKGTGGNIPCGEVYIAPKNVEGKLIIDLSSRNRWGTILVKQPITLTIKKSLITNIQGYYEARLLANSINWTKSSAKKPSSIKTIGELGIGINPKAKIIGSMIVDEKVKGTAHIGIGSNYWFGGDIITTVHLDQVFNKPNIFIDGEEIKI
jgi:hypothetical protein